MTSLNLSRLLQDSIASAGSRERMMQAMNTFTADAQVNAAGSEIAGVDIKLWVIADGRVIGGAAAGREKQALELYQRLNRQPGTSLNSEGDKYVIDGNDFLLKIAAGPTTAEQYFVASGVFPPPQMIIDLRHQYQRSVATLWKQAK